MSAIGSLSDGLFNNDGVLWGFNHKNLQVSYRGDRKTWRLIKGDYGGFSEHRVLKEFLRGC